MALVVGGLCFTEYGEVPRCVHARLILAEVDASVHDFVILTPDHDVYTECLHPSNQDLTNFFLPGPNNGNPVGVPANVIDSFAPMTPAEYAQHMAAGQAEALAERARRGLPAVAAPMVGGGAGGAPGGAAVPAVPVWCLAEMVEGHKIGEEVHPPVGHPVLGDYALMNMADSSGTTRPVLIKRVLPDDLNTFCEERIELARSSEAISGDDLAAADDLRTMAVKYLANGDRRRAFKEAVGEMSQVEMEGFPFSPRTCLEYLTAISTVAESAHAQHLAWVQQSHIPDGSRAIYEDQVLAQVLDLAISFDCLQISNLASFEMIVRRRQLLAEAHSYDPSAPNFQGADYWLGNRYKQGGAIVMTSLTEHVAKRLQADSAILKEKRKLEEAKGKGGGKGSKAAPKGKPGGAAASGTQ